MVQVIERELLFQPGHGFQVGTVLYSALGSGATEAEASFNLAQSDSFLTLPIAIVSDVPNVDQYRVAHTGIIDLPAHSFTVSAPLFGSADTPGELTEDVPLIFKNAIAMAINPDQITVVHFNLGGPTIELPTQFSESSQVNSTTTPATKDTVTLAAINATWVIQAEFLVSKTNQNADITFDMFENAGSVVLGNRQPLVPDGPTSSIGPFSLRRFVVTTDSDSPVKSVSFRFNKTGGGGSVTLSDLSMKLSIQAT